MSFTRVHHVGLVTNDLPHAHHVLCDGFGLAVDQHRTPWPGGMHRKDDGASVIQVPIGEMYYEVAEPAARDVQSEAAQFLAAIGGRGGMHYLAIASDDPEGDVARLLAHGVKVRSGEPGSGAVVLDAGTCLGLELASCPRTTTTSIPPFAATAP